MRMCLFISLKILLPFNFYRYVSVPCRCLFFYLLCSISLHFKDFTLAPLRDDNDSGVNQINVRFDLYMGNNNRRIYLCDLGLIVICSMHFCVYDAVTRQIRCNIKFYCAAMTMRHNFFFSWTMNVVREYIPLKYFIVLVFCECVS